MSFDWSFKDYFNLSKRIPLHFQKRYLAKYNNGSFNTSMLAGVYKTRIKKLLENNRILALALQNDRVQKEELLAENRANADLVLFSRLKLVTMSESLKKTVSILDEALGLLDMHSSKSVSKFSPKNTVCREEFKEQQKKVIMVAIPEENELPEAEPTKIESLKTVPARIESPPAVPAEIESHEKRVKVDHLNLKKTKDASRARRNSTKRNPTIIEQKNCENKFTNENSKQIKMWDEMVSPIKTCVKFQVNEKEDLKDKLFSLKAKKKNVSNRKRVQKTKPQATDNSKEENFKKNVIKTETLQFNHLKEKVSSESNLKESNYLNNSIKTDLINCESLNFNSAQKHIYKGIQQEKKRDNLSEPLKCNKKKKYELYETVDNSNNEDSSLNECLKNSTEKLLFDTGKENVLNKDFKKSSTKKTALKNISSNINIENMKLENIKRKSVFTMEDLSLIPMDSKEIEKRKSICPLGNWTCSEMSDKGQTNKLLLKKSTRKKKENLSSASNTDKPSMDSIFWSKKSLSKKEEMVKSLAENTVLVTAEVHKTPPNMSEFPPKINTLQPVVLLNDVFEASKSLCKNITALPFDQASGHSLEKQLLQHCSSLKIIAENSSISQNQRSINADSIIGKSVDQSENFSKTIFVEPPLLEENEFKINEDKRTMRRRGASICYREPSLSRKLRSGQF